MQHIGNDFSSSIDVNILPGIQLPNKYHRLDIYWQADNEHMSEFNCTTANIGPGPFYVKIGRDVRDVQVSCYPYSNYSQSIYRYSLRVDQLLFLKLAIQLLSL